MLFTPDTLPTGFSGALILLFAFAIFHALGDYGLQGEFLSRAKNRGADLRAFFGNDTPRGIWVHALFAHALIHAGGVWLVSGSVILGAAELILHVLIDHAKGADRISFTTDQILHHSCKISYVVILVTVPEWIY